MIGPRARAAFVATLLACALATHGTADAIVTNGSITQFVPTSSGNMIFTVADVSNPALAASQTYTYQLNISVGLTAATITLAAPTILGTQANQIPYGAFTGTCTFATGPLFVGAFVSSGAVSLGASPVTCATISAEALGTLTFTVSITLDTRSAPNPFVADTYTNAPLAVTVNAP